MPNGGVIWASSTFSSIAVHAMIQERVRAGLARAKAEGKQLGRPKIAEQTERAVQAALKKKHRPGLRKIASTLGVGVGTVQRISRELG